jgi:hypothetical protein
MVNPLPTTDAKVTGSPQFTLSKYDIGKIVKGAGIAVAGAFLAYLSTELLPHLDKTDYAWLIPLASILVNLARTWLTNSQVIEIPLDERTVIVTPEEAAQPVPPTVQTVVVVQPEPPPLHPESSTPPHG